MGKDQKSKFMRKDSPRGKAGEQPRSSKSVSQEKKQSVGTRFGVLAHLQDEDEKDISAGGHGTEGQEYPDGYEDDRRLVVYQDKPRGRTATSHGVGEGSSRGKSRASRGKEVNRKGKENSMPNGPDQISKAQPSLGGSKHHVSLGKGGPVSQAPGQKAKMGQRIHTVISGSISSLKNPPRTTNPAHPSKPEGMSSSNTREETTIGDPREVEASHSNEPRVLQLPWRDPEISTSSDTEPHGHLSASDVSMVWGDEPPTVE